MLIVKVTWSCPNDGLEPRGQWLSHAEVYAGDTPDFAGASMLGRAPTLRGCFFHKVKGRQPSWYFVRLVDTAGNPSLPIGVEATTADAVMLARLRGETKE